MYQDYKSLSSTIRNIMEQVTKKSLESSGFKNVQEIGNIGFVFLDGVSYRFRRIDSPKKSTRTFSSAEKAKNALVGEWNETRGQKPPEEVPTDKPKSKPEVKPGGMANVTGAAAVVGKPEEKPEPEKPEEKPEPEKPEEKPEPEKPEEKPEPEDKKELPKTSPKTTTDKDKTLEKDIDYDVFRKPRGKEGLYKGAEDHIEFHKNFLSGKTAASKHLVEKNQFSFSPELRREILDDAKFPTHYLDVIERMMNVSPSVKISDVLPRGFVGGAGKIPAQAGEIMTMMGTSMSNKQFSKFYDALSSHLSSSKTDLIVQQSWLDAAANNRAAILIKQSAEGFTHDDIEHSVWDTPQEVEALGLKDYNKNKGFSTDFYMRVAGNLVEQSLKKDEKVNFINSGSGQFASLLMTDDESAKFDNLSQQQQDLLSNLHDGKYKSYTELINRIDKIQNKKNIRKKDEDDLKELNEAKKKYDEIENSKPQPPNDINIGGGRTISFDVINQEVAGKNQKQLHLDFFKDSEKNLELAQNIIKEISKLDEDFSNYKKTDLANLKNNAKLSEDGAKKKIQYDLWKKLNEYDGDYSEVFDDIINDRSGSARDNNKCMYLVASLIRKKSENFEEYKESLNNLDNEFVEKSFAACANDDRMKNGILRAIQKDFPLKLVFKGEENMVIGSNMLDTKIAQRIFGVDSWDEVLPKLQAKTSSKGDPYLAYTGEINGQQKEIPIATIGIRPDGKHYGGQWKFEMGLHKSLANEIANHNALEYGLTDHSLLKDLVEIKGDRDLDDEIDSIKGKSTVRDEMMRLLQGKNNLTTEAKKSIIDKLGQTKKNLFENFISLVVNNYKSLASSIHTILRG